LRPDSAEAANPSAVFHYSREFSLQVFGRPLACSSEIYFAAPQAMLHAELRSLAAQRFLSFEVPLDESAMLDFARYLPAGQRVHLQGYIAQAAQAAKAAKAKGTAVNASSSGSGHAPMLANLRPLAFPIANLVQTPGMFSCTHNVMPALLRGSRLFSLALSRPLLSLEHFIVQGICIPEFLPAGAASVESCPFDTSVLQATSDSERRSLTGNCMHLWQVGSALMLCLAELSDLKTVTGPGIHV